MLILRLALGSTVLLRGLFRLFEKDDSAVLNWPEGILAMIAGAFLLAGFLTPLASVFVFAVGILFASINQTSIAAEIYVLVLALAILLLGPGAFSLDAHLFGRREIIIPKAPAAKNE